jgi:hypothetical protein
MASNNQGGGNKGNQQSGDTSNRGFASMDPDKQRMRQATPTSLHRKKQNVLAR